MRSVFLIATILVGCSLASGAQADPPKVDLPGGAGAWVLQITTHGGFEGRGGGDLLMSSTGRLRCSRKEMSCPEKLTSKTVVALSRIIATIKQPYWINPVPDNFCQDCLENTMTLTVRDHKGSIETSTVHWNITSQKRLPPQLLRLYSAATGAVH